MLRNVADLAVNRISHVVKNSQKYIRKIGVRRYYNYTNQCAENGVFYQVLSAFSGKR